MNPTDLLPFFRAFATLLCTASMLAQPGAARANQNPSMPTKLEALQLPKYCHAEYGIPSDVPMPTKQCGILMNHFCKGLVALNRASKPSATKSEKRKHASRARKNIESTKRGMPAGCPLAGEVMAADSRLQMIEKFAK